MNREQKDTGTGREQASHAGLSVRGGRTRALTPASVLAATPMVTAFPQACSHAKAHPVWLYPGNGLGGVAGRQLVRGGEGTGHVLG